MLFCALNIGRQECRPSRNRNIFVVSFGAATFLSPKPQQGIRRRIPFSDK